MQHRIAGYKLNRRSDTRKALFYGLARQILLHECVETTLPKAKAVRGFVEKLVTLGKKGTLAARRRILSFFPHDKELHKKIIGDFATRYEKRHGGYTRILKMGYRYGDQAPLAQISMVDFVVEGVKSSEDASQSLKGPSKTNEEPKKISVQKEGKKHPAGGDKKKKPK